jgi:hypothetical protein
MSFIINNKSIPKKKAEDTINFELLNTAISKLLTDTTNTVIQSNKALAISIAGASNTLNVNGLKCNNLTISNISQSATSNSTTKMKTNQTNITNMSSSIVSSYDNIQSLNPIDLTKYTSDSTTKLNKILNIDLSDIFLLTTPCGTVDIFNISNNCNSNTSYNLNKTIKDVLELDDSFKINDESNTQQTIDNIITNKNFGLCLSSNVSSNTVDIKNILCNNAIITNISQEALTDLYMNCVFDQSNKTEITSSISTKILNRYNQIYDKVAELAITKGIDYYNKSCNILDAFVNASIDKFAYNAGLLQPKTASTKNTNNTNNTNNNIVSEEPSDMTSIIMNYINNNFILLTVCLSIITILLIIK